VALITGRRVDRQRPGSGRQGTVRVRFAAPAGRRVMLAASSRATQAAWYRYTSFQMMCKFLHLLALQNYYSSHRRRTSRMRDRLLIRFSGPILVKDKMHAKFMAATVLVVLLRVSATI